MSFRNLAWASLLLGLLTFAAIGVARDSDRRPLPAAPFAQSQACQACMREQCAPPADACRTECQRSTLRRPPREFEACETACVQRYRACIATCPPCGGAYRAPPGVEPFSRDAGGPRVVTLHPRRGR